MSSTNAIVTGVYPMVSDSLKKNLTKYKANIAKFIEARSAEIYEIAPFHRIYFGADDLNAYFTTMGFSEADVQAHINKTYYGSISAFKPKAAKDPMTVSMIMIIRYFYLNKMEKELELSCIYLAFSGKFYPSLHYNSFPKVQPIEYRHIMEYVVNNELSQKFDLKREGSVFGAVRSICNTWVHSYGNKLKSSDDEDVVYVIQQLHNRICSFMKNIAELYYEAYENKDILTYDSDNADQDNFHIADSDSLKAQRYIEKTMTYITTQGVNYKVAKMSSNSDVKTDELFSIIQSIQSDSSNTGLIKELVSVTVLEFLKESKIKEVTGHDFIKASIAAKPNTKNPNILRQKQILEELLSENSPQYLRRRNRLATKNSYYRCLLLYYVLIVNQANK